MLRNASIALLGTVVLTISACGSDGSKNDAQSRLSVDPSTLTADELKQNYSDFADSLYQGKLTAGEISPDLVQKVIQTMLGDVPLQGPRLGDAIWGLAYQSGEIGRVVLCDYAGTVSVDGELGSTGHSNLALEFDACQFHVGGHVLTGKGAVTLNNRDDDSGVVYFNEVNVSISNSFEDWAFSISGYSEFDFDRVSSIYQRSQYLLFTPVSELESDSGPVLSQWSMLQNYEGSPAINTVSGRVYIADVGFLDIETPQPLTSFCCSESGLFEFVGANDARAVLGFEDYDLAFYREDSDGDGEFDRGSYIASYNNFLSSESVSLTLVGIESMSFPPEVYTPYFIGYSHTRFDDVEVGSDSYFDRDTPYSELTVSYEWRVNDVLVPDVSGSVFPSGLAVFGDAVSVRAFVSDGINVTSSDSSRVFIEDSPAVAQFSEFEGNLKIGESLDLSVTFVDPDNIDAAIPASLVFGPSGMTMDDAGSIQWTSDQMLFDSSTVTFGVRDPTDATAEIMEFSVLVSGSSSSNSIARSGVNTPSKKHSMIVGDFLGDSDQEVLVTDNDSQISILVNRGDTYTQEWLYPYALPTAGGVVQLLAYQLDDDDKSEIIAVTENGISAIYSTTERAVSLWETDREIHVSAIFDANNNGIPEIAIIHSGPQYSSARTLQVIELTTPVSIVFETTLGYVTRDISVGNVDVDGALELVTNDGFVYDTLSWENEWFFGEGFGVDYVSVGDFDGDGVDEIAGASNSDGVYVYSAVTKTIVDSLSQSSICSVGSADIDSDASEELVVTSCYSYSRTAAFSLVDGDLVREWEFDINNNTSRSLAFGDSDNDGIVEIHWADDSNYNNFGSFVVVSTESESSEKYRSVVTEQFYNLSAAGWGELTPGVESAVFITPETNNGRGRQHLIYMDELGNYSVSAELGSSSDGFYGDVVDFNSDGYAEIFLATGSRYSEGFSAIQMSDLSVHWSASDDFSIDVSMITSADMNDDDFIDAIYADGNVVRIVDVENQTLLGSFEMEYTILDIAVNLEGMSSLIAVSDGSDLSIWKKSEASYIRVATVSQSCRRLNFGNVDDDVELELVCLGGNNYYNSTDVITYEVNGETLTESHRVQLDQSATDFVFDTSQANSQTLLVAKNRGDYGYDSEIVSLSPLGERVIWTGPGLIGRVAHRSMHFRNIEEGSDAARLMFATDKVMYLVK